MGYVKVVDKIDKVFRVLVIIAFIGSLATVGASIFMRNVLSMSFPWSEEVAKYLTIFIVFCTAGLASRNGGLTRLTFVIDIMHLKSKGVRIVEWGIGIISIAFYMLVAYSTYKLIIMVQASRQVSAALKMPQWIPMISMLIGCGLLILNTLAYLIANGKGNEEIERSEAE